jgi:hypothetical protein
MRESTKLASRECYPRYVPRGDSKDYTVADQRLYSDKQRENTVDQYAGTATME